MEQFFNEIRLWIWGTFCAMAAFLSPISGDVYSMVLLFAGNVLFGVIADTAQGNKWQWRKMWEAFKHAVVFFSLTFFIYGIVFLMHNEDGAQHCVSFVVDRNCTRLNSIHL